MTHFVRWLLIAVLAIAGNVSLTDPVLAQTSLLSSDSSATAEEVALPDPLTSETIRELVSRLSDAEVRELLLQRLDLVAQEGQGDDAGQTTLEFLIDAVNGIGTSFTDSVQSAPRVPDGFTTAYDTLTGGGGFGVFALFVGKVLLMIAAGLAAEFVVTRLTLGWLDSVERRSHPETLIGAIKILSLRAMLQAVGLVAYIVVSLSVIPLLFPVQQEGNTAHLFNMTVIVLIKLFAVISRFLTAPNRPDLRLITVDDHYARSGYVLTIFGAALIGCQTFIVEVLRINGVPMGELRIGYWLNLLLYIFVIWMIYAWRDGIRQMISGVTSLEDKNIGLFANLWPAISITLAIANWVLIEILANMGRFDLLRGQQHVTLLLIIFSPAFDTAMRGIVHHMAPPLIGEGPVAEAAHKATMGAYIRIGRVILVLLAIFLVATMWDLDLANVANAGVGVQLATSIIDATVVLFVGYMVWEIINLWINRRLAREATEAGIDLNSDEPGGGEGGGTGLSRLATVLPVLRLVISATIVVMTVLIGLSELGVDTTPLLAGAGIVGLAVGFGAQTLVRDVVSGLFFLVDDAFRVGEYLVIDNTVGTVEKISLRSLQLRHHQGPVHTIPYGEIPKVTNNSRDWVIMKLKFTVPFETDVNKVKKIFKKIGAEMLEAEYAEDIIQTFKSQGVYDVDDVGIVIRGKFMTKPGKQWVVRKDVYSRVQKAFAENGIEFARKEVRVNLGEEQPTSLSQDQKTQIGAAVADAAEPPPAPADEKAG